MQNRNFFGGSKTSRTVQWKMSCITPSTNGDSNGCFQNRLESIMPGSYYTGSMVQTEEVSSRICVRTSGNKISLTEFHKKVRVRVRAIESKSYTFPDRKYNSIEVFEKDRRCEVFGNDQIKQRDMGLSSITWHHNYHRIPPKQTEHNCRQGIQGEGRFFRVETRPKGVSRASSINGEPSIRFVCISTKSSITLVHSLETGSIQSGHRCNPSGLVSGLLVCLSPLLPYKQNFTEGKARKNAKHVLDNTNMAHSTLVSIPSSNVDRNTSYLPKDKHSSQRSFRERASLDHQQNSKVSGMENLRERLSLSWVSGTASRLIANPRRSSSTGNYESARRKWVGCCRRCDITPILDFLAELFNGGYDYRTINSHRSAISAYH